MGDSRAHKELKKEKEYVDWTERPEWVFKVFKKPAGLMVNHMGDRMTLSKRELKELSLGKVDMARYPAVPKRMYRTFMVKVCEALGIIYRPYMLEQVTPPKVKRVRIEFPKKMPWDTALEEVEELKKKEEYWREEIAQLEEFFRRAKKK